jgi:hypothetical protein
VAEHLPLAIDPDAEGPKVRLGVAWFAATVAALLGQLLLALVLAATAAFAAYDAGDFLVGTGATSPWEGPVAGVVAVGVCGFGAWVVAPAPLGGHGVLALAVVTAVLAPLGSPAASVLIGDGCRPARFVRRLDTLLVLGPVAAWAAAGVVPEPTLTVPFIPWWMVHT